MVKNGWSGEYIGEYIMRGLGKSIRLSLLISLCLFVVTSCVHRSVHRYREPTLLEIYDILQDKKFVDLTHTFEPGIPHWPGFPDEKRETIYWYGKVVTFPKPKDGSGFPARVFAILP